MSYNFIVMNQTRPDKRAKSFTISKPFMWLIIVWATLLPVIVYFLVYYIAAPKFWIPEAGIFKAQYLEYKEKFDNADKERDILLTENMELKSTAKVRKKSLTEAETHISIAENARADTSGRMQELEEKVVELQQTVTFYEDFVKPSVDKDILQCFNIKLKYNKNNLYYGVNFLRNDQSKKKKINANVKFSLSSGANLLDIKSSGEEKIVETRNLSIVKDVRLSGNIKVGNLTAGLRVLNIKAYENKTNKVLASCWKTF